jgi:hypothetical protein
VDRVLLSPVGLHRPKSRDEQRSGCFCETTSVVLHRIPLHDPPSEQNAEIASVAHCAKKSARCSTRAPPRPRG